MCRGSERWDTLCLPINKELGPGTPKMVALLFLLLALSGAWVYVRAGVWSVASGLRKGISTGPYFSIS